MFGLTPDSIKLTDSALKHFKQFLEADKKAVGIRLTLKNAGCGGFEYQLDIIEQEIEGDDVINYENGIHLYIPKLDSWRFLGTEIDYVSDSTGARMVYKNPNEAGQCGCGLSVNFK